MAASVTVTVPDPPECPPGVVFSRYDLASLLGVRSERTLAEAVDLWVRHGTGRLALSAVGRAGDVAWTALYDPVTASWEPWRAVCGSI